MSTTLPIADTGAMRRYVKVLARRHPRLVWGAVTLHVLAALAALAAPRLLLPSVQINIDAGRLPTPRENGRRYMSMPINLFKPTDEVGLQIKRS